MKTLLICHLETDFQYLMSPNLVDNIITYSTEFERVINITSTSGNFEKIQSQQSFEEEEWIWMFDIEHYPEFTLGVDCIKTDGHKYSEVCQWMRELPKTDNYTIVGGHVKECLLDVFQVMQHLELSIIINNALTY